MTGKLITNDTHILAEKMRNVIPNCENIYALVGYFYFSGFSELSEDVKNKKMKILVGMDIDALISGKLREVSLIEKIENESSDIEIRKEYYEKLTTLINETDSFDSSRQEKSLKLFIEKIKDGTLEIRKTREPNHAKIYIFENDRNHNENGDYLGIVVTGSSNFSYSGLAGRNEINVMFRDNRDFEEAKTLFEKLWNNSVEIVGQYNKDDFFTEVKEKIWTEKIPAPILLFIRALSEYFSVKQDKSIKLPDEINKKYANFKYQSDAIQKALTVIERHNGVIVADVVGLGKSVIASAVAHNLKLPVIIIAPPHLTDQWENYRMQFNYNARVFSSGKIEDALNKQCFDEKYLIIIDEAARYRNPETKDYALLHKLCQGNKVILLTATPFNNNPEDVFALIQLFQIPAKSTIRTVQNLSGAFRELIKEYSALQKLNRSGSIKETELKDEIRRISMKIREIIFPVVIRRTRIDLDIIEEYKNDLVKQGIHFPIVNEPVLERYDLGKLAPLYESTTEEIYPKNEEKKSGKESFKGARYRPLSYLKPEALERMKNEKTQSEYRNLEYLIEGQKHIAGFMRTLLVRRFESSIEAFRKSVDSILSASEEMQKWFEKGRIPVRKKGNVVEVDVLLNSNGEELEMFSSEVNEIIEELKEKGYNFFLSSDLNDEFITDLKKDIHLLKKIKKEWEKIVKHWRELP
ncbi:MAG TPA: phospholipase D-like domain-containing protein, partial [bacterium]|nr:phospholipase D-like domain-containing protein [bacterium]